MIPQSSYIDSRNNTAISLRTRLTPTIELPLPIVAANMDTVCGVEMYKTLLDNGCFGIPHRNCSQFVSEEFFTAMSLTLSDSSFDKIEGAFATGYDTVVGCLDIAHGHMFKSIEFIRSLKNKYGPHLQIISGSVANHKEIEHLIDAGVDTIRTGVGGGSMCFVPGTKVFCGYKDGYKSIEDIRVGDTVISHTNNFREVINSWESHFAGNLTVVHYVDQNGKEGIIKCTPPHKFVVGDKFVKAKNLKKNDILTTTQNSTYVVVDITQEYYDGLVYDIEVDIDHTYAVTENYIVVSNCTTRIVTGHGVPNFTNICLMKQELDKIGEDVCLMADGGIKTSGDIIKALAAGADTVMIGNLFAATKESPGEIITQDGKNYKKYRGQASKDFMIDNNKTGVAAEGESMMIPFKGSVVHILKELIGGIKSGMTYSGAYDIQDLRNKAEFIKITQNGFIESKPHGLSRVY